jgi:hypothetical protein
MANRHSSSQPKFAEPDRALRLVKSDGVPAADLPKDGIRPTRQGPWDPCRFQEYLLSPEFRMQVMSAKLPPADPKIFLDTSPPAEGTEIGSAHSDPLGTTVTTGLTPRETSTLERRDHVSKKTLFFAGLVVIGALALTLVSQLGYHANKANRGADASSEHPSAAHESTDHARN